MYNSQRLHEALRHLTPYEYAIDGLSSRVAMSQDPNGVFSVVSCRRYEFI